MDPANLKYTKSHEWVGVDGDVATIGISDFAIKELTDLVFLELPEPGRTLTRGEIFGEVESVKAVSDLYAPISGEVVEKNAPLADDLAVLSNDAYDAGWMLKVKMSDPSELDEMMDRAAYEEFCNSAGGH